MNDETKKTIDPLDAEIEELRRRKAEREAAAEQRAKKHEAARLRAEIETAEIRDQFTEQLGPMGVEWEMIDLSDFGMGPVVVKRGLSVILKRFQAAMKKHKDGLPNDADTYEFVAACLAHPSLEDFKTIVNERPAVVPRCANALYTLYGEARNREAGKY